MHGGGVGRGGDATRADGGGGNGAFKKAVGSEGGETGMWSDSNGARDYRPQEDAHAAFGGSALDMEASGVWSSVNEGTDMRQRKRCSPAAAGVCESE